MEWRSHDQSGEEFRGLRWRPRPQRSPMEEVLRFPQIPEAHQREPGRRDQARSQRHAVIHRWEPAASGLDGDRRAEGVHRFRRPDRSNAGRQMTKRMLIAVLAMIGLFVALYLTL